MVRDAVCVALGIEAFERQVMGFVGEQGRDKGEGLELWHRLIFKEMGRKGTVRPPKLFDFCT